MANSNTLTLHTNQELRFEVTWETWNGREWQSFKLQGDDLSCHYVFNTLRKEKASLSEPHRNIWLSHF